MEASELVDRGMGQVSHPAGNVGMFSKGFEVAQIIQVPTKRMAVFGKDPLVFTH
jgi:hypothetical protein